MKYGIKALISALLVLILSVPAQPVTAEDPEETVMIGFIDSGISTRHISPDHVAEGINYVFPDNDTRDRIGHGTATAGLVLGSEDLGIKGVCPEAVALPLVVVDLYPSGVVNNGGTDALVKAIYDAVDRGCRIINASLSTNEDTRELRDAVAYAESNGVLIVSASGNDGEGGSSGYPASYGTVISVGSADRSLPAEFSQNGADVLVNSIDLTAPTHRGSSHPQTVSGTSYACALVSGFCAKILTRYPGLTPSAVRKAVFRLTNDILEPGFDARSGWGVLADNFEVPSPFPDIRDGWAREGITYVSEKGLMSGAGDGLFDPGSPVTRAMLVTILWRMEGSPSPGTSPAESTFEDVVPGMWYSEAVKWAVSAGLVNGYSAKIFCPDKSVSREEAAAVLYRYAQMKGASASADSLAGYSDRGDISSWAEAAMNWAVSVGILTGTGKKKLSPSGTLTRAQGAAVIMRLDRYSGS
ncbi:MAG: S8 family serine peptidase [Clostridia bacterium]|nr:S8 family serine peptidase [Clostridia bacterium]